MCAVNRSNEPILEGNENDFTINAGSGCTGAATFVDACDKRIVLTA